MARVKSANTAETFVGWTKMQMLRSVNFVSGIFDLCLANNLYVYMLHSWVSHKMYDHHKKCENNTLFYFVTFFTQQGLYMSCPFTSNFDEICIVGYVSVVIWKMGTHFGGHTV
jgi:hypothetical protein